MAEVLLETDTYDVHIDPPQTLDVEVDATAEQLLPLIGVNQNLAAANRQLVEQVLPTLRGGLQTKEVAPADIEQVITPDDGYLGLQRVKVAPYEREVQVVNRRMNDFDDSILYRAEEVAEQYYRSDYAVAVAFEFSKIDATTNLLNADAYLTSDGDFYDSTNIHTWHDDNDKHANRFIVCYFKVGENKSDFDISYFTANRIAIKGDLGALIINKNIGLEEIVVFDDSSVLDIRINTTQDFLPNIKIKNIINRTGVGSFILNTNTKVLELGIEKINSTIGEAETSCIISSSTINYAVFPRLKSILYGQVARSSTIIHAEFPELEVYNGNSANHYIGIFASCSVNTVIFQKLHSISGIMFFSEKYPKCIIAPKLSNINTSRLTQLSNSVLTEKMVFGSVVSNFIINSWNGAFTRLIHFEFGADGGDGLSASENFRLWTCTDIDLASNDLVEDTDKFSTNKQQLLYNFKTYTIERLSNRTGKSKLTLTIGANLYTIVTEETDTLIENTPYNEWLMAKLAEINWSLAKG